MRDVSFRIGRGESYGLVGRVRFGQVDDRAGRRALPGPQRPGQQGQDRDRRPGRAGAELEASCASSRQSTVSMVYQEPGRALNPTIRVGRQVAEVFEIAGESREQALERAQGDAREGADLRPGRRDAPLSAPAVRRHAPARRDRDGAGRGALAADPRRADHRARRDGRGRGARSDRGAAQRVRDLAAVHQPQPRR